MISVNGVSHELTSTSARTDVAVPPGKSHVLGFTDVLILDPGANDVCVSRIDNAGAIDAPPLVCRTVNVD